MSGHVNLGDVGTDLVFLVDYGPDPADLMEATCFIKMRKPSGRSIVRDATFDTDGSDGVLFYTTQHGDIDEAGTWNVQVFVCWDESHQFHSSKSSFVVSPSLRPTIAPYSSSGGIAGSGSVE